ncbi:hypothetical protein CYMTET_15245 [Cymbomonas tetramitiformis]|uniref:Uncharacterized protein n=1 Tax=Cymbomonas tetramitiformis TaxID=36881 RepID=A0AAE0GEV2_9CHLO|nr:hypothetical protein CYMTET_15245 [Cymbomonas tetramitiformis]
MPRVEPAQKPAALTKPAKFKGHCCWNFNKNSGSVPEDTFYTVENYVPAEHWEAMDKDIRKERAVGNVVMVKMEWNIQDISAVGVVAKERKGVLKFKPVWDYSRPEDVGGNSRIDLEKEKFSSIKDAYALLRPGLWMAKLDLTTTYRSVPVAAMYWIAHVFEWDEEVVYGLSLYTRYAHALLAQAKGRYLHLTDKAVQDLKVIVTVIRLYTGHKSPGISRGFLEMLPAEDAVLADWVVYMVTERAVKPDTAKKYTSGVRALHVQLDFECVPVWQRWAVHAVLQGSGRRWDTPSRQVMPLGFEELLLIAGVVNPHNFNENEVFPAMDTAFFCFF